MLDKVQNNNAHEESINPDSDLIHEIDALSKLEQHLDWAITVKEAESHLTSFPNKELEVFFMNRLKLNPFWEGNSRD